MKFFAPLIDLFFLVLFVGIGRSAHDHGITVAGTASTLWPFGVALAVGWMIMWWRHRSGEAPREGAVIVVVTVALGMVLRVVSGQGTAFAFIVVALSFLILFLVGWRLAARTIVRHR